MKQPYSSPSAQRDSLLAAAKFADLTKKLMPGKTRPFTQAPASPCSCLANAGGDEDDADVVQDIDADGGADHGWHDPGSVVGTLGE